MPIGQGRAFLLHIDGIPPVFLGLGPKLAQALGLARGVGGLHGIACGRIPLLGDHVDIAGGEAGRQAREIIGGYVIDVVAKAMQDAAQDFGVDVDARPIEERDLDRILGFRHLGVAGPRQADGGHETEGNSSRDRQGTQCFSHMLLPD